jgi:hypothetical protein
MREDGGETVFNTGEGTDSGRAIPRTMSARLTMASMMLGGCRSSRNEHDGWKVDVDVCGLMSA